MLGPGHCQDTVFLGLLRAFAVDIEKWQAAQLPYLRSAKVGGGSPGQDCLSVLLNVINFSISGICTIYFFPTAPTLMYPGYLFLRIPRLPEGRF